MFKKLQQKWKVSGPRLALILITFAIGGSATGFIGKKIMNLLSIDQDWLWTIIYILLITIIWPMAVLVVSVFFGQYKFFSGYIRRMGVKMGIVGSRESGVGSQSGVKSQDSGVKNKESAALPTPDSRLLTRIAIFASGAGTNAENIIEYFTSPLWAPGEGPEVRIALIVSNKKDAGVLSIAKAHQIPTLIIEKEKFFRGNAYVDELKEKGIDFIVLAGFLWKIPDPLLKAYPKRIINIHPALLPKYGGKGMYGQTVHEAVLTGKERESGITIHYVDDHYDNGDIILQVKCAVLDDDSPETLAHRIHALEYANYPVVIAELLRKSIWSK